MEANGRSTSLDTPMVVAGIVLGALVALVLLNRISANVNIGVK